MIRRLPDGSVLESASLATPAARRRALQRLTALDLVTLLYVAVATAALLAFSGGDPATWAWLLAAHALLVTLVLLAPAAREAGPLGRFLGDWYPMLLLLGLYAEVGVVNLALGAQHDQTIQRLEQWVFGSQVSYRWIREMPNPAFSWVMHACYIAYYAILFASPLGLWFTGRRDAARRTILAVMVVFYFCYVVFLFYPVAGPRYTFDLAHNAATRVWPARAAQWLLDRGDAWGAAFPSSHVAAAVVATLCALRFWRPLGLVLTPFTLGLVLSVVYGQFHYAVDAAAGLLVAVAVFASQYVAASAPAAVAASLGESGLETGRA
ncbi:MAG TPA: phosphatase PAP2 family protein [Gemmatimonadales bacterium]|nr:phosphatase PAP2 family protein [Gemmatimonadales bacterium]